MVASPGGTDLCSRKRRPAHEKQAPACSYNIEARLGPARKIFNKTFRERTTALRRNSESENTMKWFVLGKGKNFMAFKVFCARRDKRTIVPSARLPFRFRKFNTSPSVTAEQLNAKLRQAQENRLKILEQVCLRARNLARLRGKNKDSHGNQKDDG